MKFAFENHAIRKKTNLVLLVLTWCVSPVALASNHQIHWEYYLLGITIVAILGAWWITNKKDYEAKTIKFLAASVYFWAFIFLQTGILAGMYAVFR